MQRYEKNQSETPKEKIVLDGKKKTRQFKHQTLDCEDCNLFVFLMLVTQLCPTL